MVDQVALVAALRTDDVDFPPDTHGKRLGDQFLVRRRMADENDFRWQGIGIELSQKRLQHHRRLVALGVARKIGAVAEIGSVAEEKNLNARLSPSLMDSDDVGLGDTGKVDVLARLDPR